jgi:hypothetical protein
LRLFPIGVFGADVVTPQHIQNDHHVNSTILVKVQAIPLHGSLSSSSSSEEDFNSWHFTCFLEPQSGYTAGMHRQDDEQERGLCCQQILASIIVEGGEGERNEYCRHHLARVPTKTLLQRGVDKKVVPATFDWIRGPNSTGRISTNYPLALADYSLLLRIGGRSKVAPSVMGLASPWWSSSSETMVNHQNTKMEEMDDETTPQEDIDKSINLLTARVSSRLSTDGGMHRELRHAVTIECPPPMADENESDETETVATGTVYLLLVLPEDFFMDMDDPVVGGAVQDCGNSAWCLGGCIIHYYLVEHDLVDIEQPAFDSPQHVVGIKLSFEHQLLLQDDTKDSSSSFLSLQFTTKIHTRYPVPVGEGSHRESTSFSSRRKSIGLPAPLVVGGNWQVRKTEEDLDPIVWFLQEAEVATESAGNQQWLSTTVAAGSHGDYPWVILGTLMCSLIGAALTMRDLALVSIWDAT